MLSCVSMLFAQMKHFQCKQKYFSLIYPENFLLKGFCVQSFGILAILKRFYIINQFIINSTGSCY